LQALRTELAAAQAEVQRLSHAGGSTGDVVELDDERVLQEVGIYRYHHPLENAEEYRDRLRDLHDRIKESVKTGDAILASEMFTFDNSLAKGRRMTSDLSKLMLRAYNAEADNCVRSLRAGNVVTAKKRLEASVTSIARLGSMMEMTVNPTYHAMRLEELELTADFAMKVQEEKERAREERERLREERKAALELAAERERLDKERTHYLNAIEALRAGGNEEGVAELLEKVDGVDQAIAHNDYRAANIRAGYVYVISNEGAFGKNMVKIGLTRRLEPLDRVRELGGASVPFPFDVHALFFSQDAVSLETELHHAFADMRVNHVNERREFFFATPHEVRLVLAEKVGNLLEFTEDPEATQYRQSRSLWPSGGLAP
jgi:cell division septum initiation protein DivIVA